MHAAPNPLATYSRPGRPRYGVMLRRLVGGTILLSGTMIFAADIAWSAAGSFGHPAAKPPAGLATK